MSNSYINKLTEGVNLLSFATGSIPSLFQLSDQELAEMQLDMICGSFTHHFKKNAFFRDLCQCKGLGVDDIKSLDDLIKIPLTPISAYKGQDSHRLLSVPITQIEHEMRSTGTSGVPSVARRCSVTVDAGVRNIYGMCREFLKISKGAGLYLSPSTEEIPEMGMCKTFNLLSGLLDTRRFMVRNEKFSPEDALAQLDIWSGFTRHIIGPPFLIYQFISFLKETGTRLKLDRDSLIITLGGWKRFTGKMISRVDFSDLCQEWLGVPKQNIRDMYALVESNLMAIEDERGVKHISPATRISVRDVNDLDREVPLGEQGQLAIYDPTNLTAPGFLLTEDIVVEDPKSPDDKRSGQRMRYIMRAPTSTEFGCCAVNLEEKMDSDQTSKLAADVV